MNIIKLKIKNNSRRMDYSTSFKCYGDACKNVWIVIKIFT